MNHKKYLIRLSASILITFLAIGTTPAWASWYFDWSSNGQSGEHGPFNSNSDCESQRSGWSRDMRSMNESASSSACYERGGSSGSNSSLQSGAFAVGEALGNALISWSLNNKPDPTEQKYIEVIRSAADLSSAGEYGRAARLYARAMSLAKNHRNLQDMLSISALEMLLGCVLTADGQNSKAIGILGDYQTIIDIGVRYLSAACVASAYINSGDRLAAIMVYESMTLPDDLRDYGFDDETFRQHQWTVNSTHAIALTNSNQYEKALAVYKKALFHNPAHLSSLKGYAIALRETGNLEEARIQFRRAHELDPTDTSTLFELASISEKQKKYADAEMYYQKYISLKPTDKFSFRALANVQRRQDKYEIAEQNYRRHAELNPGDSFAQRSIGEVLSDQGKEEEAIKYYENAVKINGKDEIHWYLYASTLTKLDRSVEAESAFRDGLKIQGQYERLLHAEYSKLLFREDRLSEAEAQLRAAMNVNSTVPVYYYRMSLINSNQGKHKEAIQMATEAVRLAPEYDGYNQHLARLEPDNKSYSARYQTPLQRIAVGLDKIYVPIPESAAGNPTYIESEKRAIRIVNNGLDRLPSSLKESVMDMIRTSVGEAEDGTLLPLSSDYENRKKIWTTSENLIANVIALLENVKSGIKDNIHISDSNLKLVDKIFVQTIDDLQSQ